jgi:murein DD-endopeptidase MepM/ murein hydrolase activator NlpD
MTERRLAPPVPGGTICGRYPYAWRNGEQVSHAAIDFCAPLGTPILAVLPGVVVQVSETLHGGRNFIVRHDGGLYAYYAHCDRILVQVGQRVERFQQMATVGQTGSPNPGVVFIDPHLHMQVQAAASFASQHYSPLDFLAEQGIEEVDGVMVWHAGYPRPAVNVAAVGVGVVAAVAVVFGGIWWSRRTHSMRPRRSRG